MASFSVIGAGAWGTVIAKILAENNHDVTLWCYKQAIADQISEHSHHRLPDIKLPDQLTPTINLDDCYDSEFVILGLSSSQLIDYEHVIDWKRIQSPIVVLAKGLVEPEWFISKWLEKRVKVPICILSGPNLAYEIAQQKPAVTVLASENELISQQLQQYLSTDYFRCYTSTDIIGVQVGGIFKNVLAIAAGCIEALQLGVNARSALITRGTLELSRIIEYFGGTPETVMGISGLGDLIATCSSDFSRNWQLGYQLVQSNKNVQWIDEKRGQTEGVRTIQLFYSTIVNESLNLPIMLAIGDVFVNNASPSEVIQYLMKRGLKSEF